MMNEKTDRANDARRRLVRAMVPAVVAAALMAPATGAASDPAQAGNMADTFEVRYTATFSQEDLVFEEVMAYDVVRMKDGDSLNEPGKPMLPARTVRIALPEGMTVTGVLAGDVQSIAIRGEYEILPAQPLKRVSDAPQADDFTGPDPIVYASVEPYPERPVRFTHETDLAGQAMAVVRFFPVSYIAAEKRLTLHTSIEVVLEGVAGYRCGDYLPRGLSARRRAVYEEMVRGMVVNPDDVELRSSVDSPAAPRGVGPGDYDYVIITRTDWVDDFQPLADWKTKKGTAANIVTTDWIYYSGGYSGSNQDKIRAFVQDARANWGTIYFLLGGDTNVVPYHTKYILGDGIANDTYYGDYDSDWTCEVHIGRAAVRTSPMIDVFIDKVLTYEKNPPLTSYGKTAAFLGFDLYTYGSGEGENCKADIDYLYLPNDWTYRREYDSEPGGHKTDVIGYLNQGNNLVNHIDHCSDYSIGVGYTNHGTSLTNSNVSALSNGDRQSIFYSIGCWPCAYDEYTCIAEAFVQNATGGGIAFVGNSRYGWYSPYNDDHASLRFDRYFFRSLLQQGNRNLGVCFSDHKNDSYQYDDYYRYIFTELTLLGDPELPIWTDDPEALTVIHDDGLIVGEETTFPVQVYHEGNPVLSAVVCLFKADDVYEVGVTNGYGEATFVFTPESTGIMDVTVTCPFYGYLPSEGQAEVTGGSSIPGDLDGDGDVDTNDLLALLADWGCSGGDCLGDVDEDGDTDTNDLLLLLANWG